MKSRNGKFPHKICTGAIQLTRPTALYKGDVLPERQGTQTTTEDQISKSLGILHVSRWEFPKKFSQTNQQFKQYISQNIF